MEKVSSQDGTAIAYEVRGEGPPVVLVGGAFNDRHAADDLAGLLAADFTAVSYDRRGRGDSGDTAPYAIDREIEDLAAVIEAAGGSAFVYGNSSGAVLAMRAAAAGAAIRRLALLEPPFRVEGAPPEPEGYLATLVELTSTGRPGDAVEYFMTRAVGLPPEAVAQARQSPAWPALERMAPTLVYDAHVMVGSRLPTALLSRIATPALLLDSTSSPDWLRAAASATAEALPAGEHRSLEGALHTVPPETLAVAIGEFFRS
jgi:pimeloyl-ACP methyl ester carboxylesterase